MSKWRIHPTAIIDSSAEIDPDVEIGPYCVVGENVKIGAGSILHPHVVIEQNTTMGRGCKVFSGAIIGGPPLKMGQARRCRIAGHS